jgi:sugar phosphate isomerase/epimerase
MAAGLAAGQSFAQAPASQTAGQPTPRKYPFALGLASYTTKDFTLDQTLAMSARVGLTHLCLKSFHLPLNATPDEIAQAVAKVKKSGLVLYGGGVIQMKTPAEVEQASAHAKAAGMTTIVGVPYPDVLPLVNAKVQESNIRVAIHNHGPEDKHFPSPEVALKALDGMDPRMGVCLDVGHTTRTGTSPVQSIQSAGNRLLDVHIKDLRNLMDAKSQCAVGEGVMPVVGIFEALKKMNYQGYVNLEYEIEGDDPMPGMAKSFAYMKGVLAGLRG